MQKTSNTNTAINFRKMQSRDVAAVEQLVQAAYRGGKADVSWKNEHDIVSGPRITQEGLSDLLQSSKAIVLVAETEHEGGLKDGGNFPHELAGCVLIELESPDTVVIGMLAVGPNSQNLGLGRKLVATAESAAKAEFAATKAHMHVACIREELLAWYKRLGYEPTGVMLQFPGPEAGITALRDGLEFAVIEKSL